MSIQLLSDQHEFLEKQKDGRVLIRFELNEVPNDVWVRVFNNQDKEYTAKKESKYITLLIHPLHIKDISNNITETINTTNALYEYDKKKEGIILSHFEDGMIVLHSVSKNEIDSFGDDLETYESVPGQFPGYSNLESLRQYLSEFGKEYILFLEENKFSLQKNRDNYEYYVQRIAAQ